MNSHDLRPDRIASYFRMEWLPLLLITLSGLAYNLGLLAVPWFEGRLAQALAVNADQGIGGDDAGALGCPGQNGLRL